MVELRPGRPDDAEALSALALRAKAHWGYPRAWLESWRPDLTLPAGEVTARRTVVAERDGQAVGFATLEGQPPCGALGMLFVEPAAIGTGVGRALYRQIVLAARALGFAELTVESDPHAERFYRAMGATPVGANPSSVPGRLLPVLAIPLTDS